MAYRRYLIPNISICLPPLPDTEYLLCYDPSSNNELAQVIYQAMESYHNPAMESYHNP